MLPKKKRIEYELIQSTRFLASFFTVLLIITASAALLLATARASLRNRVEQIARPAQTTDVLVTTLERKVRSFNDLVRMIGAIEERTTPWSLIIDDLTARTPKTIHLSALTMEREQKLVIRGIAERRNDLLEYKNRLMESPWFTDFEFPTTNLVTPTSVPFEIRSTIQVLRDPNPPL